MLAKNIAKDNGMSVISIRSVMSWSVNLDLLVVQSPKSLRLTLSSGDQEYLCSKMNFGFKGEVYDSGESLLIFELNSQTNTPLPSVLLQTRTSNAQH